MRLNRKTKRKRRYNKALIKKDLKKTLFDLFWNGERHPNSKGGIFTEYNGLLMDIRGEL